MYAVVRTGGKQYRVEPGILLEVEKLQGGVGDEIEFSEVLLCGENDQVQVGRPLVDGARVLAEIVEQKKGPKQIIFKKIRRQGKKLKKGHRQELTQVRINEIKLS